MPANLFHALQVVESLDRVVEPSSEILASEYHKMPFLKNAADVLCGPALHVVQTLDFRLVNCRNLGPARCSARPSPCAASQSVKVRSRASCPRRLHMSTPSGWT
eukprot:1719346-Pyramimonas_sp.AAC.1